VKVYKDTNQNGSLDVGTDALIVTYRYDGLTRRIQKIVAGSPDVTYDYYHNPSRQILETRKGGNTNPLEQFVWSPRYVHSPVCRWYDSNTDGQDVALHYYTNDANFNVTALINTDGSVAERVVYDPYGKPTFYDGSWANPSATSAYSNDVLFTGHRLDAETGLYYGGLRYYNYILGDWTTRGSDLYDYPNLYGYVGNRPTGWIDPWGLWGQDFHQVTTQLLATAAGMCFPQEIGEWAFEPDLIHSAPAAGFRSVGHTLITLLPPLGTAVGILTADEIEKEINEAAEWHFPREQGKPVIRGSDIAKAKYKAAIGEGKKCNLKDFAMGLHTLQDSWAHQGIPPLEDHRIGHSRKKQGTWRPAQYSEDADNVEYWPEDARAAAMATFQAMKEFLDKCPCILEGPHTGEKSRCGDTMKDKPLDKWLNGLFPGKNVEAE